jgi:hypothetical protein
MCLGGPNHCRVGWVGSQSYHCLSVVVLCLQRFMCVLDLYVVIALHASCSSSYGDAGSNVLINLAHTHTYTQKKIALVIRGCHRNEEDRYRPLLVAFTANSRRLNFPSSLVPRMAPPPRHDWRIW